MDNFLMKEFIVNTKKLDLPVEVIKNVLFNNRSGGLPYHGTEHLITVANLTQRAAQYYGMSNVEKKQLFLAGVLHDHSHSGKSELKDRVNISLCLKNISYNRNIINVTGKQLNSIKKLIKATEFPHDHNNSLVEKIIQDSDILQTIQPEPEKHINNLFLETGFATDLRKSLIFIEQNLQTSWGFKQVNSFKKTVNLL